MVVGVMIAEGLRCANLSAKIGEGWRQFATFACLRTLNKEENCGTKLQKLNRVSANRLIASQFPPALLELHAALDH
jgi:hypothetical protein